MIGGCVQNPKQRAGEFQKKREKEIEDGDSRLQQSIGTRQRNGPPVHEPSREPAADGESRHEDAEYGAHGKDGITDHDREEPRPNDFVNQAASAREEKENK